MDSEVEELSSKSVSATARVAGAEIKTMYTFGPGIEVIEIFADGQIMAKFMKDKTQDVYCNVMKHDALPPGTDVSAATVISANNCTITTEICRRGKRESIAVYKNDVLLCRSGNTILEE